MTILLSRIAQIAIATLLLLTLTNINAHRVEVVASWRLATFAPPTNCSGSASSSDSEKVISAFIIGLQVTSDKIFLGIPRFQPGHPISLGWVPRPQSGYYLPVDTPINPFPDWNWHRAAAGGAQSASMNCSALVSVFHMKLDGCGTLWVLDSGVSDAGTNYTQSCPPKILAFNAVTGQELHRYEFTSEVILPYSLFTNFALDDRSPAGSCPLDTGDLFIYIADSRAPGIVVYDLQNAAAWRHDPPQSFLDPDWAVFKIAGDTFVLLDNIIGLTVSLPNPIVQSTNGSAVFYDDQLLYFHAFASNRIYSVPTKALQAQPILNEILPIQIVTKKKSQSNPLIIDPKDGSLVYSPVSQISIESYQPANNTVTVKAYDFELLQGVTDIFIEPGYIWAVSSRIQKYFGNKVSPDEVNVRIVKIPNGP